ncbi:MAG: hypothetical protein QXS32_08235 [Candidatus Nezhaarchaeales archaeon]
MRTSTPKPTSPNPSLRRARILSRIYNKDARAVELILRNSDDILFVIPIYKLVKACGRLFRGYVKDEEAAMEVIRRDLTFYGKCRRNAAH